jgi:urease alpha subunit
MSGVTTMLGGGTGPATEPARRPARPDPGTCCACWSRRKALR